MSIHSKGPTLDALSKAWTNRDVSKSWPASFEEAMQSPIRSRLLMIAAIRAELRALQPPQAPVAAMRVSSPVPIETAKRARWMDTDKDD